MSYKELIKSRTFSHENTLRFLRKQVIEKGSKVPDSNNLSTCRHCLPRNFAILSLDAEGHEWDILVDLFSAGKYSESDITTRDHHRENELPPLQPLFIIKEWLHQDVSERKQSKFLLSKGYIHIGEVGWNNIWALRDFVENGLS